MTDIFRSDNEKRLPGEGIIFNRRNTIVYSVNNVSVARHSMSFDITPSEPSRKPTVDMTKAAQVAERLLPKGALYVEKVKDQPNSNNTLNTEVSNEDNTAEIARQAREDIEDIHTEGPEDN